MSDQLCTICKGDGWVCEQHPDLTWPHGNCGGPGMPCACNPNGNVHKGFTVIMTAKDGYAH